MKTATRYRRGWRPSMKAILTKLDPPEPRPELPPPLKAYDAPRISRRR
jgi:hypothetical protein